MSKELTTAELFAQAGMQVPTPADLPALTESLVSAQQQRAVSIEYTTDTPVSTAAMLAIASRMLAENYDLERVVLRRIGTETKLHIEITLDKQPDRSIKETFVCLPTAS